MLGAFLITALLLSTAVYYLSLFINHTASAERLVASVACGLMFGLGIATWAFYYRRGDGTALWLPRGFADYLSKRSKATRSSAEAFALGLTSVIAELLFIIGPLLAATLAIVTLPTLEWRLAGIALYLLLSMLSLLVITGMVGSGHSIARLQKWRVTYKRFLQFAAGGSLIILAAFLFADRVLGFTIYGGF